MGHIRIDDFLIVSVINVFIIMLINLKLAPVVFYLYCWKQSDFTHIKVNLKSLVALPTFFFNHFNVFKSIFPFFQLSAEMV